MIAFIDSGAKAGLAYFENDGLFIGAHAPTRDLWHAKARGMGAQLHTVVFEKPVVYPGGRARPNDIVTLACRGAYFAGLFRAETVVCVRPDQWKGQAPKPVVHRRVLAALTAEERELLTPEVLESGDALDAIGIGLAWFGRLVGAPAAPISRTAPGV